MKFFILVSAILFTAAAYGSSYDDELACEFTCSKVQNEWLLDGNGNCRCYEAYNEIDEAYDADKEVRNEIYLNDPDMKYLSAPMPDYREVEEAEEVTNE